MPAKLLIFCSGLEHELLPSAASDARRSGYSNQENPGPTRLYVHIFSIAFRRQCGPLIILRAEPDPEPRRVEVDPAAHAHTLLEDALRHRLSGSRAAKDQQDHNAFRIATTSRYGETGHPTFKIFLPTRGTDSSGGNNGRDDSDEAATVIQKK